MGNWKSYDELEENLSIEELIATLNAQRERKQEERKFMAAIQGVDLSDSDPVDIASVPAHEVAQAGFGVGLGVGHSIQQIGDDI